MTRLLLIAVIAVAFLTEVVSCQEPSPLHRIDAQTPSGLRELFHYDGGTLPLLSAHRGGALAGYPENCIETSEHTLGHAFSILEIDLQTTKDGQIVLNHDAALDRTTTGTGPIAARSLQELKQLRLKDKNGIATDYRMPTLDEALQWARGKTIVILEKKDVSVEVCVKKIREPSPESEPVKLIFRYLAFLCNWYCLVSGNHALMPSLSSD